jgi:hypothetical protein
MLDRVGLYCWDQLQIKQCTMGRISYRAYVLMIRDRSSEKKRL